MSKTIKNFLVLALAVTFSFGASFAADAVFDSNSNTVQEVEIKPSNTAAEVNAVNKGAAETLSNEKFKSAVNNLDSAQVDIREQLATYKTLVEQKQLDVNNKKAELSKLKKEYSALQKKMKNVEKMKKMLNESIE